MLRNILVNILILVFIGCGSSSNTNSNDNGVVSSEYKLVNSEISEDGTVKKDIEVDLADKTKLKLPEGTKLTNEDGDYVSTSPIVKLFKYDSGKIELKFEDENGNKLVPTEPVEVSIKAPDGAKAGDKVKLDVPSAEDKQKRQNKLTLYIVDANGYLNVLIFPDIFKKFNVVAFVVFGLANENDEINIEVASTPTPTPQATQIPQPTPSATVAPTATPTLTPTPIPTPIPTSQSTNNIVAIVSTPTPTPIPTSVPTSTPTPMPTPIPTSVPTSTPTPMPTPTSVPTSTPINSSDCILLDQNLDDSSFTDTPPSDLSWSAGDSSVEDIAEAFNKARAGDSTITKNITMPSQDIWNSMSNQEKGLYLLNQERIDRGIKPYEGIDENVIGVAQDYTQLLYDTGKFGHTEDGTPWERLDKIEDIKNNRDFFKYAENLYAGAGSAEYTKEPIAKAIYNWIYNDSGSSYGHRNFCLAVALIDNSGYQGAEGLLGFGIVQGDDYGLYPNMKSTIVVLNGFDPNDGYNMSSIDNGTICKDNSSSSATDSNDIYPKIILNGSSPLNIILANDYIEYRATVEDDKDENLSVDINGSVNSAKLGTYNILYSVTDSDGNSANATRVVNVTSPKELVSHLNIKEEACNSFEKLPLDEYTLNNNDWGRKYLDETKDGIQCVFSFDDNGTIKGGWYWGWPYNDDYQVKGYPEAIYGAKFTKIYNPESGFPALVDAISSVTVDLAYRDLNITHSYNTALEFWLHSSVDTSMDNIRYEIMLRFDPDGFHPKDVWKSVTIDGIEFDVYKDGNYGDSRVFINFVAKNKVTNMQLDLKQYIDFLVENGFLDMPQLYMSGVEMGVEVIYGSGVLLLDKMDVNLEFNANQLESTKLEESFVAWMSELDADRDLDKGVDSNHTGLKWRASTTSLDLRKKNGTLVQLVRSTANSYFFTMFDTPFDMSGEDASVKFTGVLGSDYLYKLMLYDGSNWCMSDKSFDSNSFSLSSADVWEHIAQSSDVVDAFNSDNSLPSLSTDGNCSTINLANIKGFGLYYSLKKDRDKGYFKMDTLALYKSLPKYGVDEKIITEDSVSEYLFGLCTTPSYDTSTNETFISNYKEWVKYLRWPGGSKIEDYDLENSGDTTTYSVGKWTEFMKNEIPSLDFLIGVSSSKGWADGDNVTQYGQGLVNYLNVDYNSSWGDNPALEKPLPLQYVEIGNEPEVVSGFSVDGYGKALSDYAIGIHNADPSVKILAPTTIHDSLNWLLPQILRDYGDNIDIVSTHDYTDNPAEYQSDITIAKNYIEKYMKDNDRRAKDEVKLAFTEFNSLDHLYRKGVIYEQSWAKIIWHAQTFSYFIQEGLYMSSLWHSYINGGHALYTRDGVPYPLHYALKFWRENIDFSKNPKVALSNSNDSAILITSIKKDNGLTLFVVNNSPYEDKTITLSFKQHQFDNKVTIKTLTHTLLSEFYDEETVADNIDVDRLRYYNPDAEIRSETDDDNVTTTFVKFPKISVDTQLSEGEIVNEEFTHIFPKYTLTVLEIGDKK